MVLFVNINVNQKVEVLYNRRVIKGTVKYKGCLNNVPGDWVGVQLEENAGKHDGMLKGRRYFSCVPGHGVFVPASKIRFIPLKRCVYNSYRTVEQNPGELLDTELFITEPPRPKTAWDPIVIDEDYNSRSRSVNWDRTDPFRTERQHHLRHSVGASLPVATWLRPDSVHSNRTFRWDDYKYKTAPHHDEFRDEDIEDFISPPSIPQTYQPKSAMRHQLHSGGYDKPHLHYPRYWQVQAGRESVKWNKWNDTSY